MKVCLMCFAGGCARFIRAEWCLVLMVGDSDEMNNGEVLVTKWSGWGLDFGYRCGLTSVGIDDKRLKVI
ncbi:hypothetical protein V6N11_050668 [Hibiscus sabdariffa]|uniref:Uncharacterized protein n=1 Tax=Hibiscus sabdariffa TaxID=183260 RepID=A0ABR2TBA7_9ROSI